MNQRLKTIKLITVSLITFIVLLVTALLINFVSLIKVNSHKRELEDKIKALTELSAEQQREIDYKESAEYIERFSREELFMQAKGEKAVEGIE